MRRAAEHHNVMAQIEDSMKIFEVGECRVCHKNCLWMPMVDGILANLEVCSNECLDVCLEELNKQEQAQRQADLETRIEAGE